MKRTLWDKFWGIHYHKNPMITFGDAFFAVIFRLYAMLFVGIFAVVAYFCIKHN